MIEQAVDFREESEALYQLLSPVPEEKFDQNTQFKSWTINDVLGHLYLWNHAAELTLTDSAAFEKFLGELIEHIGAGGALREFEGKRLEGLKGKKLLATWRSNYIETSKQYEKSDPKVRVKWAGPDMSARSKITARFMETWAHGQEVYDQLGVVRQNKDRIKNIVVLGNNTFGWTFVNRGLEVPEKKPYLKLTAPSGGIWEFNDPSEDNVIQGAAEEFCQVVTQVRSIGDTALAVKGDVATHWMSIAQCFAGPPEDPPKPGTRFTA